MAEIDRIKALAGLLVLEDEDDDLFPSSPCAGPNIDACPTSTYMNKSPFSKSISTTKAAARASGDRIRHGVVKNQQQDEILREMQKKGFLGENRPLAKKRTLQTNSSIAHEDNSDDPDKTVAKTARPSLSIAVDESCHEEPTTENANSEDGTDQLVFGRPQTFGAAGGFETNYMPNVKQRAVAISAWKILEMKKEKKNGLARAREWKVGEEHKEDDEGKNHVNGEDETENFATYPGKDNYSIEHWKKSKIPSFLSHFDNVKHAHGDEENAINGAVCQPITPRSGGRGSRVPLSPRVSALSSRNVGVSPRNVMSPRNILSPREALLKMEASRFPSPRNSNRESNVFSPKNRVLSPRSKALLSPSIVNKTDHYAFDVCPNVVKPGSLAHFHSGKLSTTNAMPSNKPLVNKKPHMPIDGVGVKQELASILERRFIESGVESIVSKLSEVCNHNSDAVSSNGNTRLRVKTGERTQDLPSSLETNTDDKQDHNNAMSKTENKKNNDSRETNSGKVQKFSGNHDEADDVRKAAVDKAIHDTLEEATRFLQSAKQSSDMSKEGCTNDGCNSDGMDVKFDEQLLSAAELARALDKFLVEDDSTEDEDSTEDGEETLSVEDRNATVESKSKVTNDAVAFQKVSTLTEDKVVFADPIKQKMCEQVQTNEWGQLTLSNQDDTEECDVTFPTDFENLTCDQLVSNFSTSIDDSLFPVAFDEENVGQFCPPGHQATHSCNASKTTVQRHRKLPKIKISIEGAPSFKIEDNGMNKASPMFFVSQPSPSCGDHAGLLHTQHCFKTPKELINEREKKESTKKHLLLLKNPTKRLNIKEFISHTFPSKHERDKDALSPSMTSLLNMINNEASMDMDENVGLVSVRELASLTPKAHQSEHFFVGPIASPISNNAGTLRKAPSSPMQSSSLVEQQALCVSSMHRNSSPGGDKKKKITNSNILQRIKSPLLNGRKLGNAGLNDHAAFGRL
ncbi:hypothetical protein HJC23_011707 [Cyclotella cryptica]|uniref:Uncharacterized protein n=1 Tax=Cyclotella cryptica TaxID=29204 RepID=A0ABD3QJD4_9STRA|eukprot:CCRYP_004827-RA/>CCRYP_004827-RA protein AED:0.00 eAED:0.00 QI:205/-1/1/1/-1/1/1/185/969